MRPSWLDYFMDLARRAATRSTCPRASVGCVFVIDNHVVTTGYNGAPRNLPHCSEVGCLMVGNHCIRASHAEQNAIDWAARRGVALLGATVYLTHLPCPSCAKSLINAGVIKVYYTLPYHLTYGAEFLSMAGISLEQVA